jgi:L-aspartate oxidase
LVDSEGRRFVFDYDPAGELAPRDVVSRAIFTHLQKTGAANVYLDLRPIPETKIRYRFPNIIRVCQQWGVDLFNEPIPVAPAAHYWMGGIAVDTMNLTSIPGLYAVGETANTGVHGANRLASNSLLECIVYAGQLSQLDIKPIEATDTFKLLEITQTSSDREWEIVTSIREELPHLVWQSAGICRTQKVMEEAIAQVQSWRDRLASLPLSQYVFELSPSYRVQLNSPQTEQQLRLYTETLNLVDIAYLILKSAVFRTESRGGHYRTDYPHTSPDWQVHTMVREHNWYTAESIPFEVSG